MREKEGGENSDGDGRWFGGVVVGEVGRAQLEGVSKRLSSSLSRVASGGSRGGAPVILRVMGWTRAR